MSEKSYYNDDRKHMKDPRSMKTFRGIKNEIL